MFLYKSMLRALNITYEVHFYVWTHSNRCSKFKCKYFVRCDREISICHAQWKHWTPISPTSRWFNIVFFLRIRCSFVSCLCNKHHAVSKTAACVCC
jgi:hypothetical protein